MHPLRTEPAGFPASARTSWLARALAHRATLSPVLFYAAPETLYREALLDAWTETFPDDLFLAFDSGIEVLQFLWNPIALKPCLLILDAHTAEPCGLSILHAVRLHPELHHLPVAILASSADREAIEKAYAMRANWCLKAPMGREDAIHLLTGADPVLPGKPQSTALCAA